MKERRYFFLYLQHYYLLNINEKKEGTVREIDLPRPGRRMLRVRQRAARERGSTGRAPRITDVTSTR